ncbi:MAG: pyrimidine dimer DNA glycosylase/endonuclease V [Chloroflexota bacterium]|nr:pyrimidine dimer DNA glycosylase/endonuclease V [Chloroflexota bacterium]
MRVWDVAPGYLNRQSLLGEHREVHAILSIITNDKKGYSRHPETLRWKDRLGALKHRHDLIVSEMRLRGYQHHSPVMVWGLSAWPDEFVDPPEKQFTILQHKYVDRELGRIPLPRTAKELLVHHRFSIMARDSEYYFRVQKTLDQFQDSVSFEQLAHDVVEMMRRRPPEQQLMNALDLMWNHVAGLAQVACLDVQNDPEALIAAARKFSTEHQVISLLESTALSDLHTWISVSSAEQKNKERGYTNDH